MSTTEVEDLRLSLVAIISRMRDRVMVHLAECPAASEPERAELVEALQVDLDSLAATELAPVSERVVDLVHAHCSQPGCSEHQQ